MSSNNAIHSYPAQLETMIRGYNKTELTVMNFGVAGRCASKHGSWPYWNENAYLDALTSEPDIVLIMLGTNDANKAVWN